MNRPRRHLRSVSAVHAGFDEPRKRWGRYQWCQVMMAAFFGSLGFTLALIVAGFGTVKIEELRVMDK